MAFWDSVAELVSSALFTLVLAWMALFLVSLVSSFASSEMRVVRSSEVEDEKGGEGLLEGEGEGEWEEVQREDGREVGEVEEEGERVQEEQTRLLQEGEISPGPLLGAELEGTGKSASPLERVAEISAAGTVACSSNSPAAMSVQGTRVGSAPVSESRGDSEGAGGGTDAHARALDPHTAGAAAWDGVALSAAGRVEEAIEAGEKKEELRERQRTGQAGEGEKEKVREEKKGEEEGEEEDEDEEDWEGLETSELEEKFNAAAALVVAMVAPPVLPTQQAQSTRSTQSTESAPPSGGIGGGMQLLLYSLYKQATEGPCSGSRPPFFNFKARAKWDAWKQLEDMPVEEAMEKYVELVESIHPGTKAANGAATTEGGGGGGAAGGRSVSTFESLTDAKAPPDDRPQIAIHSLAMEGDLENLARALVGASELAVNETDEEGRTALHWATDRGHEDAVKLLLAKGANPNVQDKEGQTALHYAAICEHESVARLLMQRGARDSVSDDESKTPADLFPTSWKSQSELPRAELF